jgi:2-phosphoglycerate kinase
MKDRYFIRWRVVTDYMTGNLQQVGWDLIDNYKFDRTTVKSFDMFEYEQANGLCKLLNSIEEENDGLSK